MHTVYVDYGIPMEISPTLAGTGSVWANADVIPASKPRIAISEIAVSELARFAVRETVSAIYHWLSEVWVWLMHTGLPDWVSHAIHWLYALVIVAVSWLLALFSDHN